MNTRLRQHDSTLRFVSAIADKEKRQDGFDLEDHTDAIGSDEHSIVAWPV
ncbi:MAG: hypothetical protein WAU45_04690 [Blastocatellia bacterium]